MHSYTGAFPEGVQITLKDSPNLQTHLVRVSKYYGAILANGNE